ncbi:TonB-dependent receptor [Sphingopyxis panaciterrae]|uniref:TonB-dependent receptor n=1 Tax=Sphingopyxis panaciterrae TaxID=363841 RepID=UPI001ABBB330|nr:TonB-dependent receptor [Sphingopyxis panaciterrae]
MINRTIVALLLAATAMPTGAWAQNEVQGGEAPGSEAPADNSANDGSGDIIVTANKRPERQLDVPSAISAFRGSDLLDAGYTSLKDYLALTPGVQVSQVGGGGTPVIRGLTTGTNLGAIVGIVIDGAPVGPSSSFNLGGANSTDLDPIDLERVEVLKGPQGTLYGANTLGGLVSYTFARPSLTEVTAIARGELSGTQHGGTGYSVRAAASAPVVRDMLGLRVSGYIDRPSGFIDNGVAGVSDFNRQRNWGINGSLRFEPSPDLSINIVGFHQRVNQPGQDYIVYGADRKPLTGDLKYDQQLYNRYRKTSDVLIGTIDYDLGFGSLTSVTSYQKINASIVLNALPFNTTLPFLTLFGGEPVPAGTAAAADALGPIKKFSQELRLASSGDGPLQYVFGAFYTHERARTSTNVTGYDANFVAVPTLDPAIGFGVNDTYEEIAGFGNLTYKIGESLDLTGGLRVGRIRQSYNQTFYGSDAEAFNAFLLFSGLPAVPADTGTTRGSETVKTYLLTARYHFSPDGMVYARYATGFRPGGPNFAVPGLPASFKSDSTENFEGGVKSKFWDGKATIDISAFYMRWKDILIQVSSGGLNAYTNGGNARVYGVEGSLSLRPVDGLTLAGTLSYNDGKITRIDPLAAASVGVGDPLPNSPKWSGSLALDYRTPVSGDWTAVVGATAKFVGQRHTALLSSLVNPDYLLPGYALFDARAGFESDHVDISLFVRNLTDKRAQLSGTGANGINEVIVQRPRTIGVAVTFKY